MWLTRTTEVEKVKEERQCELETHWSYEPLAIISPPGWKATAEHSAECSISASCSPASAWLRTCMHFPLLMAHTRIEPSWEALAQIRSVGWMATWVGDPTR
jgi:hypothetical protein